MTETVSRPRRRLDELSFCNLLFCAMVLLLHLCSDSIVQAEKNTGFYLVVYSLWKLCAVAVYGFLFLSGLKAFLGSRKPLKDYYLRRAWTVLLPYLVWSLIYYVIRATLNADSFSPKTLLFCLVFGSSAAHLYYIIALLQFYLLIPLWRRMVDHLPAVVILPLLAILSVLIPEMMGQICQHFGLPNYLDRFFVSYLFVWCAGCYAGAQYEAFKAALHKARWPIWIAALLLLPVYLYCGYQNYVNYEWYSFLTPLQQYFHIIAIAAILALAPYGKKLMRCRVLQALDRASYQIYLAHMLPLLAAPRILSMLGVAAALPQLLLRSLIVLVPTLGGCLVWQWLSGRRNTVQ